MKKQAVALSALTAVLLCASAHAQDTAQPKGGPNASDAMLGSEKKTPAAPAADASKPESKLGSNAKTRTKTPIAADGTTPGPYGVGLKKVPRKKTAKQEAAADAPAK